MLFRRLISVLLFCLLPVAVQADQKQKRILVMGDSMLATNKWTGRAISDYVEKFIGLPVMDMSAVGARIIYNLPISGAAGLNISQQFRKGDWKWIIVNGGGNDLWLGCGCTRCDRKIERLVSKDGRSGEIPKLLAKLRSTGAKVVYVGYMRSPGRHSPIEACAEAGAELERRLKRTSSYDKKLYYLSLKHMVPHGDRSFHKIDMIHPSQKGSAEIAKRIAKLIRKKGV